MSLLEKHFRETEECIRAIDKQEIALWLLNKGYYPERYVLPPSFVRRQPCTLEEVARLKNLKSLGRQDLVTVSYPKSSLGQREFGIQHPDYYHDIVYHLIEDWNAILNIIFNNETSIYPYSFPVPINTRGRRIGSLRSGRMAYQWVEMAENHIVAETYKYDFILKADISNFYSSIYTHSIAWSMHGRNESLGDREYKFTGNKIDRLIQCANDRRTNGIPIGSALSDLISEILLADIDKKTSLELKKEGVSFIGARFKDDYKILCRSYEDARIILKTLVAELKKYNLVINEDKTQICTLPEGLYRPHMRDYNALSPKIKKLGTIDFTNFEHTLINVLDIYKSYPGTSILEKFLSELYNNSHQLKLEFDDDTHKRKEQLQKAVSLIVLIIRSSDKCLACALAFLESLHNKHPEDIKPILARLIRPELHRASKEKNVFALIWLVFFCRYIKIDFCLEEIDYKLIDSSAFLQSVVYNKQCFFLNSDNLFRPHGDCQKEIGSLARYLDIFHREESRHDAIPS